MRVLIDLTGQRFGKLVVVREVESHKKYRMWLCQCDCGRNVTTQQSSLRSKSTTSCGCAQKEAARQVGFNNTRHGACRNNTMEPTYQTWLNIMQRCYDSTYFTYSYYGGRGIKVYEPWHKYENFLKYLLDNGLGKRKKGQTIGRINNNKDYEPNNIEWQTSKEQNRNKRNNVLITIQEETKLLTDWARQMNLDQSLVSARIHNLGWTPERAVLTPVQKRTHNRK